MERDGGGGIVTLPGVLPLAFPDVLINIKPCFLPFRVFSSYSRRFQAASGGFLAYSHRSPSIWASVRSSSSGMEAITSRVFKSASTSTRSRNAP